MADEFWSTHQINFKDFYLEVEEGGGGDGGVIQFVLEKLPKYLTVKYENSLRISLMSASILSFTMILTFFYIFAQKSWETKSVINFSSPQEKKSGNFLRFSVNFWTKTSSQISSHPDRYKLIVLDTILHMTSVWLSLSTQVFVKAIKFVITSRVWNKISFTNWY